MWTANKASPSKGWAFRTNRRKLRIGVPVKDGYSDFVHVTWNTNNLTEVRGYCIDAFGVVMETLPYEYIPFATADHKSAVSYDDLVYLVYLGNFDAEVGDVTIVANRSQYVDFTLPYTESGVSMVNAFTLELRLTSFCLFIFIVLIIFLNPRTNEDFRGTPWHQVGIIFWFSFSIMVFTLSKNT